MAPHTQQTTVMWSLQVWVNGGHVCRGGAEMRECTWDSEDRTLSPWYFAMVQELIMRRLAKASRELVRPGCLFWLQQCPCSSEVLAALQYSCHKDGMPARLHQLCQPNHHLITTGGEGGHGRCAVRLKKKARVGKLDRSWKNCQNCPAVAVVTRQKHFFVMFLRQK